MIDILATSEEERQRSAAVARALGDPKRLCVLESLAGGEASVGELAGRVACQVPNMSQHLSVLRSAGLVTARRDGSTVYYRLADPKVLEACQLLQIARPLRALGGPAPAGERSRLVAEIKVATDATFEELVLNNDKPVVVDFWATWCGPCKMVAPEMEKLAAKYDGVVDVVKVDVDANPRLSQAFGIMSIPTIAYFKPGAQPQGVVGLPPARAARAGVPAHRPRGAEARLTRHRPRAGPLLYRSTPVPDRGRVMSGAGRDRP